MSPVGTRSCQRTCLNNLACEPQYSLRGQTHGPWKASIRIISNRRCWILAGCCFDQSEIIWEQAVFSIHTWLQAQGRRKNWGLNPTPPVAGIHKLSQAGLDFLGIDYLSGLCWNIILTPCSLWQKLFWRIPPTISSLKAILTYTNSF